MILRPHSLESFRPINQYSYTPLQNYEMRKKIQNFTFLPTDKIGRGYSSIVYKGQNDTTKQSVAIKVIELKSLKDQNTKRFLQNELQCLRRLDHLNVLRYINSFMTSNNCYIITELYNGGDLAKLLKEKVFFCESQIFQIFSQFYQGYLHFHSRGFIHRDIKPSNILIQKKTDQKPTYVIADFGFIKHLDQNPKDSFNVGTPVYMAPQSITSNIYTVKSDIWSMGVMLFELAYGFLPFQSKNEGDLKREICNKQLRLQQIQDSKQIFMSVEFKTLLLSCLRKNPQNRISLQEIEAHPWFKKFTQTAYDLDLRITKTAQSLYRRPVVSFSRQKINSSNGQNNYGYIGNQAIKRQKSLQSNNFALKNCQKNNVSFARDSDISIDRHREKARQLGILSLKNSEKDNQHKIKQPEPYFAQDYLKQKLNTNHRISESPKMNFLMEKKNGIEARCSLIEGMKGVVNFKNNHILKIQCESKSKHFQKRKQSFQKNDTFKTQLEISTSAEQTKMDSAQSAKSIQINNNFQVPTINSFQTLSPCTLDINNIQVTRTETSIGSYSNLQNVPSYANSANVSNGIYEPMFTEPMIQDSPKKSISPREFFMKSMHLLRFLFENLTVFSEYNGEKERLEDVKQSLEEFFVQLLAKLKRSLLNKENVFQLKKWSEFCNSENHTTFVSVIEKYLTKYSQSSIIGQYINDRTYSTQRDFESHIHQYQALNYNLLKLAEEISSANKQSPKRSIRNSSTFNAAIHLIFNLHKCIQMVITFNDAKNDPNLLMGINPQKDFQEMNSKNKDPFRIPKMVIQLKKKLITLESGTFTKASHEMGKQNISQTLQNVFRTGRVSIK